MRYDFRCRGIHLYIYACVDKWRGSKAHVPPTKRVNHECFIWRAEGFPNDMRSQRNSTYTVVIAQLAQISISKWQNVGGDFQAKFG